MFLKAHIQTIAFIWRENILGYWSANIICSHLFHEETDFRERSSRKTVSFGEQIMSKDKYPNMFSRKMQVIVFIILEMSRFANCGISLGYSPVLAGEYCVT